MPTKYENNRLKTGLASAAVLCVGTAVTVMSAPVQADPSDSAAGQPEKVYVCKYVGKPGVDERLQTGQNPIEVSVNAIPVYTTGQTASGLIGKEFADAQGRSIVIAVSPVRGGGQSDEPTITDCPAPVGPPPPPPTTTPPSDPPTTTPPTTTPPTTTPPSDPPTTTPPTTTPPTTTPPSDPPTTTPPTTTPPTTTPPTTTPPSDPPTTTPPTTTPPTTTPPSDPPTTTPPTTTPPTTNPPSTNPTPETNPEQESPEQNPESNPAEQSQAEVLGTQAFGNQVNQSSQSSQGNDSAELPTAVNAGLSGTADEAPGSGLSIQSMLGLLMVLLGAVSAGVAWTRRTRG